MGFLLSLIVSSQFLFSSPFFSAKRDDLSVPKKCHDVKLGYFTVPAEKFYVGRSGALKMGFTFEYPIERKDASTLWKYFKGYVHGTPNSKLKNQILSNPKLKRDYDIIMRNFEDQDFDFNSEGEILEVLAIHKLYDEFPENHYFITGGVEYHEDYSPQIIGEIDVYVGNRDNCDMVAVGEVKLGSKKTLSKARKQLARLSNFLVDHDVPGLSGMYEPKLPKLDRRLPSSDDFKNL